MVLLVQERDRAGAWRPLRTADAAAADGPSLLSLAASHPALVAAADAFLATPHLTLPSSPSIPAVCVLQGEVAFVPAGVAAALGSPDATTCVLLGAASPAGASLAHCDGGPAGAAGAVAQVLAPHAAATSGDGGAVSVFLVGGAASQATAAAATTPARAAARPDAGPALAASLLAALAARPERLRLRLALVGAANTSDGVASGGCARPRATSLALCGGKGGGCGGGSGSGGARGPPAPAPAAFFDRGPAVPLRLARLWADSSAAAATGTAAPPPRRLVEICGPLTPQENSTAPVPGLVLTVAPLQPNGRRRSERYVAATAAPLAAQAAALAALPDAALLAAASTSPATEPPHFVADLRAALAVLQEGGGGAAAGSARAGGAGRYRWAGGRWVRAT